MEADPEGSGDAYLKKTSSSNRAWQYILADIIFDYLDC